MLDIKPLRYFAALAEIRNFRRAAEHLHITQPPLSRQIAALEQSIGAQLLERGTRHVVLTPAGECLYQEARHILAALQRAEVQVRQAALGTNGRLKIGFTMCSAHTVIPHYVRAMRTHCPAITLELKEIISDDIPEQLLNGGVDVGVVLEADPQVGITTVTVLEEPLCVAISRSHPKARRRKLKIEDLQDESFVITSAKGSRKLSTDTLNFCRRNGFEPRVSFEVMLQQTMLSLVDEGACIALVPASMKKLRMDGIVFKVLEQAPQVRQEVAWNGKNRNPSLPLFLHTCLPDRFPAAGTILA
jgi:DNA-binding transcriptional LysR family regulator